MLMLMLMLEGRWCTSEGMLPPFMCSIWEVTTLVLVKLILVCEMHSGYFTLFCLLCYLHGLKHHLHTTTCRRDKVGQRLQWVARWAFSWRQYWVSDYRLKTSGVIGAGCSASVLACSSDNCWIWNAFNVAEPCLLRVVPCLKQHLDALWRTKHIRWTSCACNWNWMCML